MQEYKGLEFVCDNGNTEHIRSWADYCRIVEGRSEDSIDLDIDNLKKKHIPQIF